MSVSPSFLLRPGSIPGRMMLAQATPEAGITAAPAAAPAATPAATPAAKVNAAAALKKGAAAKGAAKSAVGAAVGATQVADPGIISQIFGSDSPILTAMALVTLGAALFVTGGVVYLTYVNWMDEQQLKKMGDPSSAEFKNVQQEQMKLEMIEKSKGGRAAKSKALQELSSMNDYKPKMNIPNEPGNRDARRNAARRRKQEEKQMQKKIAEDELKSKR